MLTGAKGAFIGFAGGVLGFTVMYLLWGRVAWVRAAGLGAVVILGILAIVFAVGRNSDAFESLGETVPMVAQITQMTNPDSSVFARWDAIQMGLRGFVKKPVFGWGPENFGVAFDRGATPEVFRFGPGGFDQAHSKPVDVIVTTGVVGFVIWAAMWIVVFWLLFRLLRNKQMPLQVHTMLIGAAITAYFVQNLFLFDTTATALQIYLLLGFLVAVETNLFRTPLFSERDVQAIVAEEGREPSKFISGHVDRVRSWMDRHDLPAGVEIGPVVILLIFSVLLLNWNAFQGSQGVVTSLQSGLSWDERISFLGDSIESFPPLANSLRRFEIELLSTNWEQLSAEDRELAIQEVDRLSEKAKEVEPEQWQIFASTAFFYQTVASSASDSDEFASRLARARMELDRAVELAPGRLEVRIVWVNQLSLEKRWIEADARLCEYLLVNYGILFGYFEDLRGPIKRFRPGGISC